MNKQTLEGIRDISKSMKADIVLLTHDKIIGTDSNLCSVKIIDYVTDIPYNYVFTIQQLNEFISIISDTNLQLYPNKICELTITMESNTKLEPFILLAHSNTLFYNNILYKEDNINTNPEFDKLLKLKSADGLGVYKINNTFLLSVFTGLLPVNKADTLDLEIISIDNMTFMAHYIIHKKKYDIHQYVKHSYV